MNAHLEDVVTEPEGHQGAPRSLSLRRRTSRAPEGRGAGGPAACSGTRGGEPWIAVGRWPDRGVSSRRVAAGHLGLRARMVGRSGAWIDVVAAAGSEMSRFRPRFLDLGTVKVRGSYMWTPVPKSGNLGSAGYQVPRYRNLGWGRGV